MSPWFSLFEHPKKQARNGKWILFKITGLSVYFSVLVLFHQVRYSNNNSNSKQWWKINSMEHTGEDFTGENSRLCNKCTVWFIGFLEPVKLSYWSLPMVSLYLFSCLNHCLTQTIVFCSKLSSLVCCRTLRGFFGCCWLWVFFLQNKGVKAFKIKTPKCKALHEGVYIKVRCESSNVCVIFAYLGIQVSFQIHTGS